MRLFSKLLVICLTLWAIYVSISALLGIQIVFPFKFVDAQEIPYHRWQSVRIACFITFSIFMIMYFFGGVIEIKLIKCLQILFMVYTPTLLIFTYQSATNPREYWPVAFFALFTAIIHFSDKDYVRYYFQRKR